MALWDFPAASLIAVAFVLCVFNLCFQFLPSFLAFELKFTVFDSGLIFGVGHREALLGTKDHWGFYG